MKIYVVVILIAMLGFFVMGLALYISRYRKRGCGCGLPVKTVKTKESNSREKGK
ncbi:MAG: hypothetical protein KAT46_06815 [Deltaproteobacteria bacterium]|nr:hypothetical protein [Deltaproteobacteria bacterium]